MIAPPAIEATRALDLDAFTATPASQVTINGTDYPVRQILHLTGQQELDVARLDQAVLEARGNRDLRRAMFDRAFMLVRLLVPGLPDRVRLDLTYEQAIAISNQAWAYAMAPLELANSANPTQADTGAAPAENLKPASAGSTASIQAA